MLVVDVFQIMQVSLWSSMVSFNQALILFADLLDMNVLRSQSQNQSFLSLVIILQLDI